MEDEDRRFSGTGVYAGAIGIIAVIAGLVVLAAQNTQTVTVRWLGLEWATPLIALLLGVMLAMVILDEVIGAIWRRRRRRVIAERLELTRRRAAESKEIAPDEQEEMKAV
ncbi:MAG: hypothetical protein OEP52_02725 [Acidimicrobiia bacterium]|nr:hypothetical protein [Acidimicrobiia bacterium]